MQASLERRPPTTLRPYQDTGFTSIVGYRVNGGKRALYTLATGMGKTELGIRLAMAQKRVIFTMHREELLDQWANTLMRVFPGMSFGVEQAENKAPSDCKVVFASIQTMAMAPDRLKRFNPADFSVVFIDEVHHVVSKSYLTFLAHFGLVPDVSDLTDRDLARRDANEVIAARFKSHVVPDWAPFLVGCTATPNRTDGKGLEWVFDDVVFSMDIRQGIEEGWLSPIRGVKVSTGTSIAGVQVRGGDFAEKQLSNAINTDERNALIVHAYEDHAVSQSARDRALLFDGVPPKGQFKQALVFCVDREHASAVLETFQRRGHAAGMVLGNTPGKERERTMNAYRRGDLRVLVNVAVATEGFDVPSTEIVLMARPTKSSLVYTQCLDDQTEILTPDGWAHRTGITEGDLVAGFDVTDESVKFVPVIEKLDRGPAPDERWVSVTNRHFSLRTTAGHRMVIKTKRHFGGKSEWKFEAMGSVVNRDSFTLPVAGHMRFDGVELTDDEIRLVAWFIAEGSINKANRQLVIRQATHSPHVAEIERVLKSCGLHYTRNESAGALTNGRTRIVTFGVPWGGPNRAMVRHHGPQLGGWARLAQWLAKDGSCGLDRMDARQFGIFIEAYRLADGAATPQQTSFDAVTTIGCSDERWVDRLQAMAVVRGWRADKAGPIAPTGISRKPKFLLHLKCQPWRVVTPARARVATASIREDEPVWCVSNRLQTLVTRRNGKVVIVGNCIGRGTRVLPGVIDGVDTAAARVAAIAASAKPFGLVIDLVDSGRAGVQDLNTMFGLPPKFDLGREDAVSVARAVEAAADGMVSQERLLDAESLADIQRMAEEFDPIAVAGLPAHIERVTSMAWVKTPSGYSLGALGKGDVGVVVDMLGHGHVRFRPKDGPAVDVGEWEDEVAALRGAEAYLRDEHDDVAGLLNRRASWRTDLTPPSEAQVRFLSRLGRKDLPPNLTKGGASILIESLLGRKGAR